jgi:hypothetical protein
VPLDELKPDRQVVFMKTALGALGILVFISLLTGCAYPHLKCDDPDARPTWCDDTGGMRSTTHPQ